MQELLVLCPCCRDAVDVDKMIIFDNGECCCEYCYENFIELEKELNHIFGEEEI